MLSTRDNQNIFTCTIEDAAEMEVPHELEGMGGMPVTNNSSTHVSKLHTGGQKRWKIRIRASKIKSNMCNNQVVVRPNEMYRTNRTSSPKQPKYETRFDTKLEASLL